MRHIGLTVVHVSEPPAVWSAAPIPAVIYQRHDEEVRKAVADAIKIAEDSVQEGNLPEIDSELLRAAPVPTLIDLSKDAYMMVVGCRGQDALQRTLLGSVSTGLIHHAHCPVAVIHDEAPILLGPSQLPVLVGIDGSPASELATAIAFDEATRRNVGLVALHAWSDLDESEWPGVDWPATQSIAEEVLAERLAGWQEQYPDVEVIRTVVQAQPARRLVEESKGAQLVVVGSRGRGGFAGMLVGSVGETVAQMAPVPVIVAREALA